MQKYKIKKMSIKLLMKWLKAIGELLNHYLGIHELNWLDCPICFTLCKKCLWKIIEGRGNDDQFVEALRALPYTQTISVSNGLIQVGIDSGNRRLVEVVTVAGNENFRIEDISVAKPSLGDVFLKTTGRQFRD